MLELAVSTHALRHTCNALNSTLEALVKGAMHILATQRQLELDAKKAPTIFPAAAS
jgi:hypothetical protein